MMDSLGIAPATEEEREWAAGVMASSEPWITLGRGLVECREALARADCWLYIARAEDPPCGFILIHPRGVAGSPYIASIGVAENFRNRGIGSRLLEFAESLCGEKARHIFLCVSSFNSGARALYERRGYVQVGEFTDYIIEGASEILMHKRLRP